LALGPRNKMIQQETFRPVSETTFTTFFREERKGRGRKRS
jgi:hypothetical protein